MMMSLFSVFDPVSLGGQFNWFSLFIPFVIMWGGFYSVKGGLLGVWDRFLVMAKGEFWSLGGSMSRGLVIIVMSVFVYIMLDDLFGLFPFVFTGTAHPSVTMGMGVVIWMSCVLMGWFSNFMCSAAHLVPEGSPMVLAPVLVMIESISHLIRPFTLSIRLAANMMAGHLIIGLLAGISLAGLGGVFISVSLQVMLLVLEVAVAIIQGVVFAILVMLYIIEYY